MNGLFVNVRYKSTTGQLYPEICGNWITLMSTARKLSAFIFACGRICEKKRKRKRKTLSYVDRSLSDCDESVLQNISGTISS